MKRMVEMLEFMDGNKWIENNTIEGVVGEMLDSKVVAKIMRKENIEYFRRNLSNTWDRDTWEEDMKIEARKFKRALLYFSRTDDDSEEEAALNKASAATIIVAEKAMVEAIIAVIIKEAVNGEEADIGEAAEEAVEAVTREEAAECEECKVTVRLLKGLIEHIEKTREN